MKGDADSNPQVARRKFPREFKGSSVRLVTGRGCSLPEAARSLGADGRSVRGWVAKLGAEAAELRRLCQENARLLTGREIPKSAGRFFAEELP